MRVEARVFQRVSEIDPEEWNRLGNGQPFSSHRWYKYGETVMSDCIPVYIIVSLDGKNLGRATFWVIRNEPLPIRWAPIRWLVGQFFQRRPLFICRSPLVNMTGLILPEEPSLREPVLLKIIEVAVQQAKIHKASFVFFDFLTREQAGYKAWKNSFSSYSFSDPGTRLEVRWPTFEQYLENLSPKERKHYRQRNREAERLGIRVACHDIVEHIEQALPLIRDVEKRYHSAPNPWSRKMLENMGMVPATWITATLGGKLVGCEIVLEDNGTQTVTLLGLANRTSHIYHLLGDADIRYAIEHRVDYLRWGSGAYDTKQRMGFELEYNNFVTFCGLSRLSRLLVQLSSGVGA